jgi:hypothetical protein
MMANGMDEGSVNGSADVERRGDPGAAHAERPVTTESRGLRQAAEIEVLPARPRRGTARLRSRGRERSGRAEVYKQLVADLKARYKISIRKWRKHMSGVAYELKFRDGRIKRLITAPRPRSPVSASIFLHEVGHHAIGFHRYSPRCLEEYYVWQWALREMTARAIPVDAAVLRHYRRSMHHYVRMAMRQGHAIPHELHQFIHFVG